MVHNTLLHQGYLYQGKIVYPGEEPKDFYVSSDGLTQVLLSHGDDGSWELIYRPANTDDLQYIVGEQTQTAGKLLTAAKMRSVRERGSHSNKEKCLPLRDCRQRE